MFLGTLWQDRQRVIPLFKALDEKKALSEAPFKESGGNLPKEYTVKFLEWLENPPVPVNPSSVSKKLLALKQLHQVEMHVYCKENPYIHESNSMPHVWCYLLHSNMSLTCLYEHVVWPVPA